MIPPKAEGLAAMGWAIHGIIGICLRLTLVTMATDGF